MNEAFGKYELVRRIGVGGMAEVFEARTHGAAGFVKDLVIKRILPVFNEDPEFVRMFIKEARLAAHLQHANIVQIYDFNEVEGVHFIAMEWVHGQDLRQIFQASVRRDMPITGSLAAHVGIEVLKGLHYAHTRLDGGAPLGLVHRDISPHNILISFSGEVKITDFGIAKVAALASTFRPGAVKGKLPYMSPEQANSRPVDGRSDLFSLGIVLWELLTGRRLYTGATEAEIFAQVQRADIPRPTAYASGIPRDLETVVMELLATDLDRRYQSAQEVLADLGQFASPEDQMETADYLRQLLPEEAQQDRRGDTVQEGQPAGEGGDGEQQPAQAPVAGEAVVPRVLSPTPPREPREEPPTPPAPDREQQAQVPPARWPRLAAVAAASFILAGLVSWGVAREPGEAPPPGEEQVTTLLIKATPGESPITAEGVKLGAGPLRLHGVRGARLRIGAGEGAAAVARLAVLGEAPAVELETTSPRAFAAPSPPDAGAPDRSSPDLIPAPVKRAPPRPRPAHKARPRGPAGYLDVFVYPWARVRVDGRVVGQTPIKRLELPPGRHRVELYNDQGRKERLTVTIRPGKSAPPIKRNWEE